MLQLRHGKLQWSRIQLSILKLWFVDFKQRGWCWPLQAGPESLPFSCMHRDFSVRQLPCRSEAPSQCPLLYRKCVLSLHGELLNHLLTTAWRELRQWLVNTPEWMKGLGIKWQDVLKEEQVVVEEGPAKPCRSGTSCVSLSLFFLSAMLPFLPSSCSVCVALNLPHSSPVAHTSPPLSVRFYLSISEFSIFIVLTSVQPAKPAPKLWPQTIDIHEVGHSGLAPFICTVSKGTKATSPSPAQGDCRGAGRIFSFTEPLCCCCCIQCKFNTPHTTDGFFCAHDF